MLLQMMTTPDELWNGKRTLQPECYEAESRNK